MRHLMSPLDFSREELEQLMDLADDIKIILRITPKSATAKSLQPVFTNQVHVHDFLLKLPCLILAVQFLVSLPLILHQQLKAKVFPTPFASFLLTQIFALCVILKKALHLLHRNVHVFQLLTPVMAVINIPLKHLQIYLLSALTWRNQRPYYRTLRRFKVWPYSSLFD